MALVHYWLTGMRGGERVLEEMLRLYPEADIFTHVVDRDRISPLIAQRPIVQTAVASMPFARRHYRAYLGQMPRALEELDLSAYDLVLSSEAGPAKGVIARPDATHLCYCHSPMRYIWDHYPAYRRTLGPVQRMYFSRLAHRLRQWDVTSAARVDRIVANSRFVAARVARVWGREAGVVHPPVDLDRFAPGPADGARDYYLFVSELVPYKRADLVVEAFRGLGLALRVGGDGPGFAALARAAGPNVTMLGRVADGAMADLYRGARALIFPAEEDFGIVPLEAAACGTPVIAYGRGGALETVRDGVTGTFFHAQTAQAVRAAVQDFETRRDTFDPARIAAHAQGFGAARFRAEFHAEVEAARAAQSARAAAPCGRTGRTRTEP